MNQQTRTAPRSQSVALQSLDCLLPVAQEIDRKSSAAMELFKAPGSFAQEISLAQSVSEIREMLTPEVMAPVMALMNSPLGFKTDRDPKVTPGASPYSMEVVRECFMESKLRGFHTVGNEWNIISGQFYACKNGLRRQVSGGKHFPDVTDFRDTYEVPRQVGDKGAVVKARATWKRGSVADSIECEIPVKVNNYMGADAILGKAERKLLKRVHDRLSGIVTPEGEVGEEIDVTPKAQPVAVDFGKAPAPVAVVECPTPSVEAQGIPTPQQVLRGIMADANHTLAELVQWGISNGWFKDAAQAREWKAFEDMPAPLANRLVNAKEGLISGIRRSKGGAQ